MSDTIIGKKEHAKGIEDITQWSKKTSGTRPLTNSKSIKCWAAYDSSGESVQIESAVKGRNYFCPDCNEKMHPKLGQIKAHHFSHNPHNNGFTPHCGGEGYRHFRAKTYLHRLMCSIPKYEFKIPIDIQMERKFGQDQPDILVKYENDLVLAFEIIDSNPPSEEKRERWGHKMVEIDISNWRDAVLKDSSILSGRLIPYLLNFRNFINTIKHKIIDYEDDLTKTRNQIKNLHLEKLEKLESNYSIKKKHQEIRLANPPYPWKGSIAMLKEHEIIDDSKFGVRIEVPFSSDDSDPAPGDYFIATTKKGSSRVGTLGTAINSYFGDECLVFRFHQVQSRWDNNWDSGMYNSRN